MTWEYHELLVQMDYYHEHLNMTKIMELGKQSWELVGVLRTPRESHILLFKRPVTIQAWKGDNS